MFLTLSLPVPNISKMVRVNEVFTQGFFKEYSISFLIVCNLIDFAFVDLKLLAFKVCGIIGILKIEFFQFFWYWKG